MDRISMNAPPQAQVGFDAQTFWERRGLERQQKPAEEQVISDWLPKVETKMTTPVSADELRAVDARLCQPAYFAEVLERNFDLLDPHKLGYVTPGQLQKATNDGSLDLEARRAAEVVLNNFSTFTSMSKHSNLLSREDLNEFVYINNGGRYRQTQFDKDFTLNAATRVSTIFGGIMTLGMLKDGIHSGADLVRSVGWVGGTVAASALFVVAANKAFDAERNGKAREAAANEFQSMDYFDLKREQPLINSMQFGNALDSKANYYKQSALYGSRVAEVVDKPFSGKADVTADDFVSIGKNILKRFDSNFDKHTTKDELAAGLDSDKLSGQERQVAQLLAKHYDQLDNFSYNQFTGLGPAESLSPPGLSDSDLSAFSKVARNGVDSTASRLWAARYGVLDMRTQIAGWAATTLAGFGGAIKSTPLFMAGYALPSVFNAVKGVYQYEVNRKQGFKELVAELK